MGIFSLRGDFGENKYSSTGALIFSLKLRATVAASRDIIYAAAEVIDGLIISNILELNSASKSIE